MTTLVLGIPYFFSANKTHIWLSSHIIPCFPWIVSKTYLQRLSISGLKLWYSGTLSFNKCLYLPVLKWLLGLSIKKVNEMLISPARGNFGRNLAICSHVCFLSVEDGSYILPFLATRCLCWGLLLPGMVNLINDLNINRVPRGATQFATPSFKWCVSAGCHKYRSKCS